MGMTLRIARFTLACSVLGPGLRGVLWTMGCRRHCPGCVSPEMQPFQGGEEVKTEELAEKFLANPDIEGLTFSGGEPMEQAAALNELISILRKKRDLSFFCFTGFLYEELLEHGTADQKELLNQLDILVDGPFVQEQYANLLWRGSANQRVHFLTDRYSEWKTRLSEPAQGLEFEFDSAGVPQWMGIPPLGFRDEFQRKMAELGVFIERGAL